jgi:hypothetical protein
VSGFLFGVLVCVLFFAAVACAVFGVFVRDGENRYLLWATWVGWVVLCVVLGSVVKARLL